MVNNIKYVDTHCHIDLYKDPAKIIKRAEAENVFIVSMTTIPLAYNPLKKIIGKSKNISPSLGFHPELIAEREKEYDLFCKLIIKAKYIGEVGLDFSKNNIDLKNKQLIIFQKIILKCHKAKNKIISVHSRKAEKQVLSLIGNNFPGSIIMHWYSGSLIDLNHAIKNGYYFSVNLSMAKTKTGQAIIKKIPIDKILTESDGPFINYNNEIMEPAHMKYLIDQIANILEKDPEKLRVVVLNNFLRCINVV